MLGNHKSQNGTRTGLTLLVSVVVLSLLLTACSAKPKTYTVGVVSYTSQLDPTVDSFKENMTKLGYTKGKNITYIYEGVPSTIEGLSTVAQGLVKRDVDLILSVTTPATLAAKQATAGTDIPVIFVPVNDPVAAGIVSSLTRPGGNITGVSFSYQEEKRLKWLLDVVPTIKQVFIAYNPADKSSSLTVGMMKEAAAKLGVELILRETPTAEAVLAAIKDFPKEADAIVLPPDGLVNRYLAEFIALRLPISSPNVTNMTDYLLLTSYGTEQAATGKQAARLADQIFRGVKPAGLPVEVGEFFAGVNLKAAEFIGVQVSDDTLRQAQKIVR